MLNTFVQILEGPVSAAKLKILRAADKSLTIDLTPLTPAQRDQVRQYMPDGIFGKTFCDSQRFQQVGWFKFPPLLRTTY